ncbi:hypothetical protein PPYR_06400 [Photinus pyralis]|uniref:Uncharacterized protein n=2 Tax=Photinus pyralis TaxID=7054 RepID=A0A5N4ATJ0_PHOPY|nr:polycystic kidney disease 2-like 1 protein [Photinus pyralis]KAB0800661.1 hypothetical protein PPYR_06400 [Photinus pyralis]
MKEIKKKTPEGRRCDALRRHLRCRHILTSSEMLPDSSEQAVVNATVREIVILAVFIIVISVISFIMTTPALHEFGKSLTDAFTKTKFSGYGESTLSFYDIKTANDFWTYSETVLVNSLYSENWYDDVKPIKKMDDDDQNALLENVILGVGRIRQLRVRNNSCILHDYMVRNFAACYSTYSKSAEDKDPFGRRRGTAWTYNSPRDVGSVLYYGTLATYGSGGYYQKMERSKGATRSVIFDLKANLWLTKGTRAIIYEFTVFNANVDLFCTAKIVFEFPPTGGVLPSVSFRPAYLLRYQTDKRITLFVFEGAYLLLLVYFTIEEIEEIVFFRIRYVKNFWNYVDLTSLLLSYALIPLNLLRQFATDAAIKKLRIVTFEPEYGNFEEATDYQVQFDFCIACVLFLQCIKLFKYFGFNRKMGQLNSTLKYCRSGISGYTLMFVIVFFAYAELGYLLFGSQVKRFSGFITSMITLFRTVLGDFNYAELDEADRIFAPIFFISYIFVVFYILMNMFLAIVNDAYADCKVEMVIGEKSKRGQLMTTALYSILNKFVITRIFVPQSILHPKHYYITVHRAETILKACGYTEPDIMGVIYKCGGDYYKKNTKIDVLLLMKEGDRNVYEVPPMPDLPKKIAAAKVTPIILESEFLEQNQRIEDIESELVDLSGQLDGLIQQITNAVSGEDEEED